MQSLLLLLAIWLIVGIAIMWTQDEEIDWSPETLKKAFSWPLWGKKK